MKKFLLFILFAAFSLSISASGAVVIDGTATVKMEIKNPIEAEKTAEKELKHYIGKIFADHKGKSSARAVFILRFDPKLGDQEFKIKCEKNKVIISGGRPQGLLYGTYWFIDRKMGVHLYDAYSEYCPSKAKIEIKEFEKYGKPAFDSRMYLFTNDKQSGIKEDEAGIRWGTFNLLSGNRPVAEKNLNTKYGERAEWSLPLGAHGMLGLIPAKMYKHKPHFFAFQEGRRIDPVKRDVTVDFCLTNEELIAETVKRCRHFLKMTPNAKYISLSEGDGNRGMCGCAPCQALIKKHGNVESARWVYFANRVGEQLKKDYPHVKLVIFAYIASQKPPVNIKANDNVAVQIVTLGIRRGRPYTDPRNKMANNFMKNIFDAWQKVCKNILIWDYVWGGHRLMTFPDQLLNLHNIKIFAKRNVIGFFPQENHAVGRLTYNQGCPFRSWLLARAMWDPEECGDGEELETTFCNEYFGPAAGPYVKKYYKYLRDVHWKSGFVAMTSGGTLSKAPFEAPKVTAECYKIMLEALKAAKKEQNRTHILRVEYEMLPVKFMVASDYAKIKDLLPEKKSCKAIVGEIRSFIRGKSKDVKTWTQNKRVHRTLNLVEGTGDINAEASREYGLGKAVCAYDKNFATSWTPGLGIGWTMIDLGERQFISRITTVFHKMRYVRRATYSVEGSFDKKAWRVMIPKKVVTIPEKLQQTGRLNEVYCFDDVTLAKDMEVRYIRTRIHKMERRLGSGGYGMQDAQHTEQYFNLKELPAELQNSIVKE